MVVDKVSLPDDATPTDAPPAYVDAVQSSPNPPRAQSEKAGPSTPTYTSPPTSPLSAQYGQQIKKGVRPTSSWFSFGASARTTREIKTTVLGLVRDVVKQPDIAGSTSILQSCAEACRANGLSFSAILQEQSMEGHGPIYWAVIKRPPEPTQHDEFDLVSALLSQAVPLTEATLSEIRLACLHNSDHALFQRLRRSPAVSPLSGAEEMLLGASIPPDEVEVEDVQGDEGAFVVRMQMPMFQRRMRVSKHVHLEFIARGRLWALSYIVATIDDQRLGYKMLPPDSWAVTLQLLEHSPPTWIDSRLIVEEAPESTAPSPPSLIDETVSTPPPRRAKPKPTISLRLKSGTAQLTAAPPRTRNRDVIVASLSESLMANSLQYNGSSYIGADGSLHARLEARLAQPDTDCVIC